MTSLAAAPVPGEDAQPGRERGGDVGRVEGAVRTQVHPAGVVVHLAGDHDVSTARALRAELQAAVDSPSARVVVDTTACTFVDSIVFGILVRAHADGAALGKDVVLVATSERITRTLEVTRLDRVWSVLPTVAAALGAAPVLD